MIELSTEQQALLQQHLDLVLTENEKFNLTAIRDEQQAQVLHLEDSLLAAELVAAEPEGLCADIGSGPGFPGIPLAIATGRDFVLVESLQKKARFLEAAIEDLGLKEHVSVFTGRSEDLAQEQPDAFQIVVTRAVSALPSLLELASPLLKQGGLLVAYKSQDYQEELERAQRMQEKLGMSFDAVLEQALSDGSPRSLILFRKVSEPQVQLPRRAGMAQKRPYA